MTQNDEIFLNLCLKCRRRLKTCLCGKLRPFETDSRFIILMHPKESKKERVGTGRFSHLILKNSKLLVGVCFDHSRILKELLEDPQYQTFVVYPGEQAFELGSERPFKPDDKKAQFIIIDGTWPCAKKMMKQTTLLHSLPRVSFKTSVLSEFKIKHQPVPGCLSTVESLYQVLLNLNRMGLEKTAPRHDNLMEVFRYSVDQQMAFANSPDSRGYRRKLFSVASERKVAKRWAARSLFYKETPPKE